MSLREEIINRAKRAKESAIKLSLVSTSRKNKALSQMAEALIKEKDYILKENQKDLKNAEDKRLSSAFVDRLILNDKRIKEIAKSLKALVKLKDPIGEVIRKWKAPNGMNIQKIRVPIGVIGIIYESRPNVSSDCIGLCLKTSNALILRGGSEAINTNLAIFNVLKKVAINYGIPEAALNIIKTTERKAVDILLGLNEYIDLIIPRGGKGLVKLVTEKSKIPVIKHYEGICHIYVDKDANLAMAEEICFNAKVERPGTCNAMETMLVHAEVAALFLPRMIKRFKEAGVEIRGCLKTKKIVRDIKLAREKDFRTEYLDLILSVKVVKSLEEAIAHINSFGSRHSDAIITLNQKHALKFSQEVDSAAVFINASTRLHDGYQFGLGAEMGISTDKIHCRGPMALEELTIYKYVVLGNGQVRI